MADYKAIKGLTIQTVSSDPSNITAGDVWYNSTLGKIRGAAPAAGAWATGTAFNTARGDMSTMGDGTTSSIRMAGGAGHPDGPPGPGRVINESWNGTSWTEDADLNSKLAYGGGAGTVTAGVTFAGSGPGSTNYVTNTEEWDGSSWSETADLNTGRTEVSGCGPAQTAGFCIGGNIDGTRQAVSETYDGSSWTEVADLNTARNNLAAAGTTTAAIVAGGTFNPTPPTNTPTTRAETWDGSSWTEGNDLGTARYMLGASQQGTTSSTMVFAGSAPTTGKTESYDGSSWTEVGDMSAARYGIGGCGGSNQVAIGMGGAPSANHGTKVEEWDGGPIAASNWDVT